MNAGIAGVFFAHKVTHLRNHGSGRDPQGDITAGVLQPLM